MNSFLIVLMYAVGFFLIIMVANLIPLAMPSLKKKTKNLSPLYFEGQWMKIKENANVFRSEYIRIAKNIYEEDVNKGLQKIPHYWFDSSGLVHTRQHHPFASIEEYELVEDKFAEKLEKVFQRKLQKAQQLEIKTNNEYNRKALKNYLNN